MGYSTRAEYTLELIRNPKSYDHIGRRYFATGFILASSVDEHTLQMILQKWQAIDSVTSNRIRFLFFIDNETSLTGYPRIPAFTESGYKRLHSRLLEIASKEGFDLSVSAGTQLRVGPGNSGKHEWHPQERVRKLAQQLGVAQLLPCLVWVRHDQPDKICARTTGSIGPDEVYSLLRDFCDQFYDTNVTTLAEIDAIELGIERHCGILDASLAELDNVPGMLSQIRLFCELVEATNRIAVSDTASIIPTKHLAELCAKLESAETIPEYRDVFQFATTIRKWARTCTAVHESLSSRFRGRIPAKHLSSALTKCLEIEIPSKAARLLPHVDPEFTTELLSDLLVVAPIELTSDSEGIGAQGTHRKPLKDRLARLRSYAAKRIAGLDGPEPLTTSSDDIVAIVNTSSVLHGLKECADESEAIAVLSEKVDRVLAKLFYDSILALEITLTLWLHYRIDEMRKFVEEHIRGIVGSVQYTQLLYDESRLWSEQVLEPLSRIDRLGQKIDWTALASYQSRELSAPNRGLDRFGDSVGPEGDIENIRRAVRRGLTPIAAAVADFGVYDPDVVAEAYLSRIRTDCPTIHVPEASEITSKVTREAKRSILFLAADPTNQTRLRLGEEYREIQEKLRLSELRDRFVLEIPRLAVRPADITQALLESQPQIVHFSGHGTPDGALCFENQSGTTHLVQPKALATLFEQFTNQIGCVVLNACYSEAQAIAIAQHVEYVIGMRQAIGDEAAIAFAVGFYQALGAGRTVEESYKLGCAQIGLHDISEQLTPVLVRKS